MRAVTALAIAVRLLHLAAGAQLVGVFVFLLIVARPAWRRAGPEADAAAERFDRGLLRLGGWAVATALLTGLVALGLQAATVTGDPAAAIAPSVLARLLTATQFGVVWLVRMATLALLGAFLLLRESERDWRDWWALRLEGVLLAGLAAVILAWAGHAATAEEWGLWPLVADGLHLLATGAWLGGLVPLALLLGWALQEPGEPARLVAREATRRFSALGLGGVGLLVVTGVVNASAQVRDFPPLVGTPYGRLLLVKLALLAPLLAIAAMNLLRLKPRLLAASNEAAIRGDVGRLRRNVLLEAALGLAILVVVSGLGVTPPARHIQPTWPFSFRFVWDVTMDLPGVRTRVAIGSQLAMLGLIAALCAALVRTRRWRWITAAGAAAIVIGLGVALPPLGVDAYPTTYLRPAVPYTAISIAQGLALYREHCAACHGVAGYGDGPAGAGLPRRPADLTARHTADHTVGDLFWWLTRGIRGSSMPGFGDRLSEEDRWDLINFLRTLAAAEQARGLGPVATPSPGLVAPDFAFTTGVGEGRALKDSRGQQVVLLVLFRLPESTGRLLAISGVYSNLRRLGVEVLGIPLAASGDIYRALGPRPVVFPFVVDGAAEAATTYALFRRDFSATGQLPDPPLPSHMELLIDRQGYLRARWIPDGGDGWADLSRLLLEVERLTREIPRAAVPDEHVH